MTQSHDDCVEKLREKSEIELIPELKKTMLRAWNDARRVARAMRDNIGSLNVRTPARIHAGEVCTFSVQDKSGKSYQFSADSNGKDWGVSGHNILPCLNFLERGLRSEHEASTTITKAVSDEKKHNHFYKQLTDTHPLIGTSIILGRIGLSEFVKKHPEKFKAEAYVDFNPEQWYDSHLNSAQNALESINKAFALLHERCGDELTQRFLADCKRECELLIIECCYFSFLLLDHFMLRALRGKFVLPCVTKDTSLVISPNDYVKYETDILRLRTAYVEYYKQSQLTDVFPIPNRSTVIETGQIRLPVIASMKDIEALLNHYSDLWGQISDGLAKSIAHPVRRGYAHIINSTQIGIQSGSAIAQDRLSFRTPAFNIRIDKDPRHKMLTLDIGGVSLTHALASAEENLETLLVEKKLPTVFKGVQDTSENKSRLEQQIALVASMMMGSSHGVGLRKKQTISHHSREFVGKDEYYDNFSHILASVKEGLERPAR